jgi:hypothetical protein
MTLGLSIEAFTSAHVIISLLGIFAGFVVLLGMMRSQRLELWTEVFLASTVLTSITGFMFPAAKVMPSHVVGGISLVALAAAIVALYKYQLTGTWREIYVVSALVALYLNSFIGIVQAFQKVPLLNRLAPTQSEPSFFVAQIAVLAFFLWLGARASKQFHPRTGVVA